MMYLQLRSHWNGPARLTVAMFTLLAGTSTVAYGQPTTISTPDELQDMDLDLDDDYVLTANIDLSGFTFTPVGTNSSPFTGTLDGDGFSIVNLKLGVAADIDNTAKTEVALFGAISGTGTLIENLTMTNVDIIGHKNVAGLAGKVKPDAKVLNCKVTGKAEAFQNVGGLVGHCEGIVEDSSSVVNVTGTDYFIKAIPLTIAAKWAGGLIGHIHIGSKVKKCSAHGTVSGNEQVGGLAGNHHASTLSNSFATGAVTGRLWVGGLLGHMQQETNKSTTLTTSFATGVVTATDQILGPSPGTGGLVGAMDGTAQAPTYPNSVTKSFATGTVMTQEDSSTLNLSTGGLVGLMENNALISDSYALGDVIPDSIEPDPEPHSVGGLVGWSDGDITRCFARGDVVAHSYCSALVGQMGADVAVTISDCYSTGNVTVTDKSTAGFAATGGIVGYTFDRVGSTKSLILRCFATGNVTSTGGGSETGGLVGFLWDTDVDECFAHGNVTSNGARTGGLVGATINQAGTGTSVITNSFATGAVDFTGTGAPEIGGLVGTLGEENGSPCGACTDTLTNCYSAGLVDNGVTSATTGGLIGEDEGGATLNDCFWDLDESDQTVSDGGTGLATCAMTLESSFTNWDFSDPADWIIICDESYPYHDWHGVAVLNPNTCP